MGLGLLEISVDAVVEASDFGSGKFDSYNRVGVKNALKNSLLRTIDECWWESTCLVQNFIPQIENRTLHHLFFGSESFGFVLHPQ